MDELLLRQAAAADLEAINAIYNYYVLHCTCTWQTEPETQADRETWFGRHGPEHPVIVAESAGEVVGWGSLSAYHGRAGYRHTVKNAVYVRHDALRRGIGSALLAVAEAAAREAGAVSIVLDVETDNLSAIRLYQNRGYAAGGATSPLRAEGHEFSFLRMGKPIR